MRWPQYIKNAYSRAESFSHWERFLKTTASLSNLIPPCFYNPANYGRFSVCFLSPGVSYPPVSTVVPGAKFPFANRNSFCAWNCFRYRGNERATMANIAMDATSSFLRCPAILSAQSALNILGYWLGLLHRWGIVMPCNRKCGTHRHGASTMRRAFKQLINSNNTYIL